MTFFRHLPLQIPQRGRPKVRGFARIGLLYPGESTVLQLGDSGVSHPEDAPNDLARAGRYPFGHSVAVVVHIGRHLCPEHSLIRLCDLHTWIVS